ncbi:hypothetical protein KCP70_09210 [Salmonella enterica subsp. enterica]|nr:hypothetical protein KCP70_09210 [Salmonella enterica subsp. enterica]
MKSMLLVDDDGDTRRRAFIGLNPSRAYPAKIRSASPRPPRLRALAERDAYIDTSTPSKISA